MSGSVNILIESADRCMDNEDICICDWSHVSSYIENWYLSCLSYASNVTCLKSIAHSYLFDHFSSVYDILICFIEAHDETKNLMQNCLEHSKYVEKILKETQIQVEKAQAYLHKNIEEDFPEICKAIQHRRAMYYLLVHEYHFVENMKKNGQIEDRDA